MSIKDELKKARERALGFMLIGSDIDNLILDKSDKEPKVDDSGFIKQWLAPEFKNLIENHPEKTKFQIKIIDGGRGQYIIEYWINDFLYDEVEKDMEYSSDVIRKATREASEHKIEAYISCKELENFFGYDEVPVYNFILDFEEF